MIQKILVPTDFSASAREALREAAEIAKAVGAELVVLFVDEFPNGSPAELSYLPAHVVAEHNEAVRSEIAAALAEVEGHGCRARRACLRQRSQRHPRDDRSREA